MKFSSAVSERGIVTQAIDQVTSTVMEGMGDERADLAVVFATSHFEDDMDLVGNRVAERTGAGVVIGCTAEGVIGGHQEIERSPGLSLLAGRLPDVWMRTFFVDPELGDGQAESGEPAFIAELSETPSLIVTVGDPFSIDIVELLNAISERLPGCPVAGGMASGAEQPGQTVLLLNGELHDCGAVGVALGGAVGISTVVSQGCRPIGRSYVITRADRNVVRELGGRPALAALVEALESSPPEDRVLAQQGLFLGRAINEYQDSFGRGDFLVRNVVGVDRQKGAIAVGDSMRVGATVQFHVRDAASAHEDLEMMLKPYAGRRFADSAALLFTCNGRGTRMWPDPNHDIGNLHAALGPIPTVGFFAAGELGSIGGRNFIHGHTASIAIIHPPKA
jgi:small ligand-binding sensory domain FIST